MFADEPQQPLVDAVAAAYMLRDEDAAVVVETDRPAIKRLVVEGAEGEAVVRCVGAAGGVPFDVRGLETEVGALELAVVTANCAAVLVDAEDGVAKGRVAFQGVPDCHPGHPDGVEDVVVV